MLEKFRTALPMQWGGLSISCGVQQIYNIPNQDPELTVFKIVEHLGSAEVLWKIGFLIFSDKAHAAVPGKGQKLAAYMNGILPKSVLASEIRTNPNSGNTIQVWVWDVTYPGSNILRGWYASQVNRTV